MRGHVDLVVVADRPDNGVGFYMMRRVAVLLALAMVVTACAGGEASRTSSTVLSSTTSSMIPTSTTSATSGDGVGFPTSPGAHNLGIRVDGVERTYALVIPQVIDMSQPTPLVIGFHGWGGNPESIVGDVQRWGDVAEEHGFLLAAPLGLPGTFFGSEGPEWAVLRQDEELAAFRAREEYGPNHVYEYFYDELAEFSVGDYDVEFTSALIEEVVTHLPVDEDRIYVTGFSLGGWMASRVACDLGDRVAAVAPTFHSLIISQPCTTQAPVSIASVGDSWGYQHLAAQALSDWARHHQCRPEPVQDPTTDTVTRLHYIECHQEAKIEFLHHETEPKPGEEAQTAWAFFDSIP